MTASRPWRHAWWHLTALLWMAFLMGGCRPEETPPVADEVLREGVDMTMYEMRTFITREGIRRARVEGDTAEFVGESEIHLRPLTMTFFDDNGRETTQVTANFGIYYELTEDMDAQGSVVALDRVDGQRLETERLRYVNAEDRLYSESAFTIWKDDGRTVMRGASFESDPGLDSLKVWTPSGQTEQPLGTPATPAPSLDADSVVTDTSSVAPDTSDAMVDAMIVRPEVVPAPDTSSATRSGARSRGGRER